MSSTYRSASDFIKWLMVEKKHNWWQKVTTIYMNKVMNANQIQYKILERADGRLDIQAVNILDNDIDSLDPEVVDRTHLDVLKIFLSKKWLLAETLPLAQKNLTQEKYALFCAYILYYDIIMDHFLAENDDILKFWFVIESTNGGKHHLWHNPPNSLSDQIPIVDANFDMDMACKQAISSWHIEALVQNSGNVRLVPKEKLARMKDRLLKWFMDEVDTNDAPPRRRKRPRTLVRDGSTSIAESKDDIATADDDSADDSESDDEVSRSERGRGKKRRKRPSSGKD